MGHSVLPLGDRLKGDVQTIGNLLLGVAQLLPLFHYNRSYIVTQIPFLPSVSALLFLIITRYLWFHNNPYVETQVKAQPEGEKRTLK